MLCTSALCICCINEYGIRFRRHVYTPWFKLQLNANYIYTAQEVLVSWREVTVRWRDVTVRWRWFKSIYREGMFTPRGLNYNWTQIIFIHVKRCWWVDVRWRCGDTDLKIIVNIYLKVEKFRYLIRLRKVKKNFYYIYWAAK